MGTTESDARNDDSENGQSTSYSGSNRRRGMQVDLTVNIPTMISILVLIVSTSATGVGLYYNLDKRQMATDYAIANLTSRVDKAEASLTAMKVDQTASNTNLRAEMKADLAEIKEQLDRLIFGGQSSQRQLRQWSR